MDWRGARQYCGSIALPTFELGVNVGVVDGVKLVMGLRVEVFGNSVIASVADDGPSGVAIMEMGEGVPHHFTQTKRSGGGVPTNARAAGAIVPVGCAIY